MELGELSLWINEKVENDAFERNKKESLIEMSSTSSKSTSSNDCNGKKKKKKKAYNSCHCDTLACCMALNK